MRTTIVIPTYNERENLRPLVERIAALRIPDCTILVVDDASPDGTGTLADALAHAYPLRVLHRLQKEGLGAAYVAGFTRALADGADVIVQMDADESHDPGEIPGMIALLAPVSLRGRSRSNPGLLVTTVHIGRDCFVASAPRNDTGEGADLVIGSRRVRGGRIIGWGLHRRLSSRAAQVFARLVLGFRTKDITSGFRVWRADALARVLDQKRDRKRGQTLLRKGSDPVSDSSLTPAAGYAFQEEMLYRAEQTGLRIIEHPITFRDRERGRSKLGWRDILGFFHT
ncbi:polyprenol monophosphomannose synthase, partial [Candidatus Uhrbacteria bacterium]|nr:polyprenol monophosphomannose synthase [Candidatus Uhrbacteria bacterium]